MDLGWKIVAADAVIAKVYGHRQTVRQVASHDGIVEQAAHHSLTYCDGDRGITLSGRPRLGKGR
jgi:hypothetical protein